MYIATEIWNSHVNLGLVSASCEKYLCTNFDHVTKI